MSDLADAALLAESARDPRQTARPGHESQKAKQRVNYAKMKGERQKMGKVPTRKGLRPWNDPDVELRLFVCKSVADALKM